VIYSMNILVINNDSRNGAVLMETVLTMPLLLVLLGGVMWLGQLQINRARLAVADRYMAWNLANRHRPGTPDVAEAQRMRRDELQVEPIFSSGLGEELSPPPQMQPEIGGFWRGVQDAVTMTLTAPLIVSSLFSADAQVAGLPSDSLQLSLVSPSGHFVLARGTAGEYNGTRYSPPKHNQDLEIDWEQVKEEKFWP